MNPSTQEFEMAFFEDIFGSSIQKIGDFYHCLLFVDQTVNMTFGLENLLFLSFFKIWGQGWHTFLENWDAVYIWATY